jgi:hypothetical protein
VDWIGQAWHDVTTPQPVPSTTVVVAMGAVALACLVVPWAWHLTRHVLTIVHESGHGAVALLVGRRLSGIRVHSDTSGLTLSVGKPRGPGMVATLAAGYPAPAVLGLAAAWALSRGYAVGVLWALVVLLALVLVTIRNWYGLWSVLVSAAVVVGVTVWAAADVQVAFAHVVTWFFLLGAPRAVLELQSGRSRSRRAGRVDSSDAGQLGRLTHLPGIVWVAILLLACVASLVVGGAWLVGVTI